MQKTSLICPLCHDQVEKLLYRFHLDGERRVIDLIRQQNPSWLEGDGICSRCVDYYRTEILLQQRVIPEIGPYFPVKSADDFIILPTAFRLDADQRFTGRDITICFIDSGFFLHPDLVALQPRVLLAKDISKEVTDESVFRSPLRENWHGTMTTVVCAGDGYASKGLYKGIAHQANLVLLKVENSVHQITDENIEKALQWVYEHQQEYRIRIVNISLGANQVVPYTESSICQWTARLEEAGIVVVAAIGNEESASIKPPASAPTVIAVGGFDDHNQPDPGDEVYLYHSTYGKTIDGLIKPELIAPAIWIAAPILPGTREAAEAAFLYELIAQPDEESSNRLINAHRELLSPEFDFSLLNAEDRKEAVRRLLQQRKFISPDYMHVDGTSFAAPIVSSVIAQLLEACPACSPAQIRQLLFSTAKRNKQFPVERQGFGIVHPRKALLKVISREYPAPVSKSPLVNEEQRIISFFIQHEQASQISLAGSFNDWQDDVLLMEPCRDGVWKIDIPLLPEGKYYYKFLVDDHYWVEDIHNPYREPDGFSGFNSIFFIQHN